MVADKTGQPVNPLQTARPTQLTQALGCDGNSDFFYRRWKLLKHKPVEKQDA